MADNTFRRVNRFAAASWQGSHARWRLHVLRAADPERCNTVMTLPAGATLIGRDPEGTGEKLVVDDRAMSRTHATLIVRGPAKRVEVIDHNSINGTWVSGVRVSESVWASDGDVLRFGGMVAVLEADGGLLIDAPDATESIPGLSEVARRVRSQLEMASGDDLPVMILGEADTGKERAGVMLHKIGMRWGEFVHVDIAEFSEDQLGPELFGEVADPSTGEPERPGAFRRAHNGTLLIEGIEHLTPLHQVWLLRAVDERLVQPLGGDDYVAVDVRVITASTADIRRLVQGRFHQGLLRLLRSHEIHMSPVHHRRPDLIALADIVCPPDGVSTWAELLDGDATEILLLHDWPTNLRELAEVMTWIKEHMQGSVATIESLPRPLVEGVEARLGDDDSDLPPAIAPPVKVSRAESRPDGDVLRDLMRRHGGNLGAVARELGAHRRQVYRWLDYAGVPRDFGAEP